MEMRGELYMTFPPILFCEFPDSQKHENITVFFFAEHQIRLSLSSNELLLEDRDSKVSHSKESLTLFSMMNNFAPTASSTPPCY